MAARTFSTPSISSQSIHKPQINCSQTLIPNPQSRIFQNQWLGTTKLLIRPPLPKIKPIKTTISFNLPTAKPERASSTEKLPKWSANAIKAFGLARLEAKKLRHMTAGTEALIMGILVEGTSLASRTLRANGITLLKVREEIVKLVGEAELFISPPEQPPLNEAAQRVLDWAIDEKLKSGEDGEITTSHMLLGVWYEEEEPGHKVLANLGFDNDKAKLLHALISKPGFSD